MAKKENLLKWWPKLNYSHKLDIAYALRLYAKGTWAYDAWHNGPMLTADIAADPRLAFSNKKVVLLALSKCWGGDRVHEFREIRAILNKKP